MSSHVRTIVYRIFIVSACNFLFLDLQKRVSKLMCRWDSDIEILETCPSSALNFTLKDILRILSLTLFVKMNVCTEPDVEFLEAI